MSTSKNDTMTMIIPPVPVGNRIAAIVLGCVAGIMTLIAIVVVVKLAIDSYRNQSQHSRHHRRRTSPRSFIQFAPTSAPYTMQSEDVELGSMVNSCIVETKDVGVGTEDEVEERGNE